jgi:UDP-glucuronate decarboxylase
MRHYDSIKRVLITGGAGFLGSHLCERLPNDGHDVLCVDNYFTGRRANVAHLLGNPNFEVLRHDVTFPLYVEIDEIYNLACPAAPIHYQFDPVQTTKVSVHGAINMLGLAKRTKAKIFQASTSEVYGDPQVHPQTEDYWGHVNPTGLRSCYDEGKRCAETLFFDYRRQHATRIKVARIFNTYGPRMHVNDGRVVSNFVVQALRGEEITLYGDGSQSRSFCYVDDLIEGFVRLMDTPDKVTGPMNLVTPSSSPSDNWRKWSSSWWGQNLGWYTSPCPVMTPGRDNQTSAWPEKPWLGSQKSPCVTACLKPLPILMSSCAPAHNLLFRVQDRPCSQSKSCKITPRSLACSPSRSLLQRGSNVGPLRRSDTSPSLATAAPGNHYCR